MCQMPFADGFGVVVVEVAEAVEVAAAVEIAGIGKTLPAAAENWPVAADVVVVAS